VARVPAPSDRLRVLLLPGSRERELRNHLPVLLQTVVRIQARLPVDFLMVLPNEILAQQARAFGVGSNPVRIQVGGLTEAMQGATLALACSGTVTMECAFFRVPALVLYRVAWPTYVLGRLLIRVKHIAMPNLLAGEAVYPEFIQRAARADNLAAAALALLEDAARRQSVRARLDQVVASLGGPGASGRAASAILDLLEDQPRNCG
jgi:lipid-A-disaccharide synthase